MSHHQSIELEMLARRVLGTLQGGFGHVAHADYIDMQGGVFHVILSVLAPFYKNSSDNMRIEIDNFIDKYRDISDKREREIDNTEIIIDELKELVDKLERDIQ